MGTSECRQLYTFSTLNPPQFLFGPYLFQDANPLQTIPLQTLICACTNKKAWSASIGHPDNCVSLVAPPSEASLVKVCRAFKAWVLVDQSWKASVVSHWSGNHWGDGGIGHESPRYTGFSFQLNLTRLRTSVILQNFNDHVWGYPLFQILTMAFPDGYSQELCFSSTWTLRANKLCFYSLFLNRSLSFLGFINFASSIFLSILCSIKKCLTAVKEALSNSK